MNNKSTHFQESDIRPSELLKGQQIACVKDIGRMLSRCDEFVEVNCPACDGHQRMKRFEKCGLTYVECTRCETLYMNPRPSPKVLEWFYEGSANYEYWNRYIFPSSEEARRERIFVPRVNRVLELCSKYGVQTQSLLEVGCAFGTFCTVLKSRGVFDRIVGVEPTPDLAATSRARGITVLDRPIEQTTFPEDERFDLVASFEVIEHLFSPTRFIEHCVRFMKDGGLFVVTCPNGKGFDFATLGERCNSLDHEHLNYFHPASLSRLLNRMGLNVLECLTPGRLDAELVRNKIMAGEYDVSKEPFLRRVLVEEWEKLGSKFQDFLSENLLSSNLWVVAQKEKLPTVR